jgi:cytochrome c biogenesis protein CcdA
MGAVKTDRFRVGAAVVFLLLSVFLIVPLFDSDQRTTLERSLRVIGGIVLVLLALVSICPGRRPSGKS